MAIFEPHLSLSYSKLVLIVFWLIFKILRSGRRERYLPPGPATISILGNAHLLPQTKLHLKLKEWGDCYGLIYSLKIGNATMVVLNDPSAVHQLMNKKGALFVDRPLEKQWELATNGDILPLMHAGSAWRAMRKIGTQAMSPKVLDDRLAEIQEAETNQLMFDLLNEPQEFRSHVMRTATSIASIILYGHRAPTWDDFWASGLHSTVNTILAAIKPGSYIPTTQFPILDWMPDRFMGSRERARWACRQNTSIFSKAWRIVESRRDRGDLRTSLCDGLLDGSVVPDITLSFSQLTRGLVGGLHQGASETSATAVLTSILFLTMNPHVQEKARKELDQVCGAERMPQWSDYEDLPYISCIVKEGMRIRPVIPNSLPYRAKEDSWYNDMLIPKDATVIVPVYALHHTHCTNPALYNPDRYQKNLKTAYQNAYRSDYVNRDHYAFGTGRRLCPGIHLGERTVWRMTAKILWAFEIKHAVNAEGKEVALDPDNYIEGMVAQPAPFKVRVMPRSQNHAKVIRHAALNVEGLLKQWE